MNHHNNVFLDSLQLLQLLHAPQFGLNSAQCEKVLIGGRGTPLSRRQGGAGKLLRITGRSAEVPAYPCMGTWKKLASPMLDGGNRTADGTTTRQIIPTGPRQPLQPAGWTSCFPPPSIYKCHRRRQLLRDIGQTSTAACRRGADRRALSPNTQASSPPAIENRTLPNCRTVRTRPWATSLVMCARYPCTECTPIRSTRC